MCIFGKRGVHILMIPQERKRKAAKPVHPKMRTILRPCSLCSDFNLGSVLENEGNRTVPVDDRFLDHHRPYVETMRTTEIELPRAVSSSRFLSLPTTLTFTVRFLTAIYQNMIMRHST